MIIIYWHAEDENLVLFEVLFHMITKPSLKSLHQVIIFNFFSIYWVLLIDSNDEDIFLWVIDCLY